MLGTGHRNHSAFTMRYISFIPLIVLLALGALATRGIEEIKGEAIKIGRCPYVKSANCFRYEKTCSSDWQCPGNKRCCQDRCGFKCADPLTILRPVRTKPGKCPKVKGQCMMINPANLCKRDGQCEGNYKCCVGMCGKICVPPQ